MSKLSPAAVANLVRMLRQQHRGAICVVEGGDDKAFYRRHFDLKACRIVVGYGWEGVVGAITQLEGDNLPGILGIIDADYQLVESRTPASQNVLLTDYRDLEITLLASKALDKVAAELCDEDLITSFCGSRAGLLPKLLGLVDFLGHMRWLNFREGLGLKFKSLRFSQFTNRDSLDVNIDALLVAVKNDSQRPGLNALEVIGKVKELQRQGASLLLVCSGHDVAALFSLALRRRLASHDASDVAPESIESRLRVAFEDAEWPPLRLAAEIRAWEARNTPYRVLVGRVTQGAIPA